MTRYVIALLVALCAGCGPDAGAALRTAADVGCAVGCKVCRAVEASCACSVPAAPGLSSGAETPLPEAPLPENLAPAQGYETIGRALTPPG